MAVTLQAPTQGATEAPAANGSIQQDDGSAPGAADTFIKGVGIQMWQASGDAAKGESNWGHLLKSWHPLNLLRFSMARLKGKYMVNERRPDTYNRYEEDIGLIKGLGSNGMRISIEWSMIEPKQGEVDMEAVQRYRDIFDCCLKSGLQPNATLWHFVAPQWFEELGGWTKEANIQLFVAFCVRCVRLFGDQVKMWATFNEATSSSTMGWILGGYPPGQVMQFAKGGRALANMLKAHTAAYRAIKALPGGEQHKIGFCQMVIAFEAQSPGWGPLSWPSEFAAYWLRFWWGYDIIHEWLATGRMEWRVPFFGKWFVYQDPEGKPPCDWYGLNYYSRPVVSPFLQPGKHKGQVISDLGYPIDPEGLHKAIMRDAKLGMPIYITELGVSIASEKQRAYTIESYIKEVLHAMRDGVDVRGIYYWTLLDNWEWNAGYSVNFGLFAWAPKSDGSCDRVKRSSTKVLEDMYEALPNSRQAVASKVAAMDLSYPDKVPAPEKKHTGIDGPEKKFWQS